MQEAREILATGTDDSAEPRGSAGRTWYWIRRHLLLSAVALAATVALAYYAKGLLIASPAEIVIKGDALHARGDHAAALAAYRRAAEGLDDFEKVAVFERIVRCSREAGDEAGFIAGAIDLLAYDQEAWFGDRNLAIAQMIIEREISLPSLPAIGRRAAVGTTDLAIGRLRLAIAAPGPTAEEKEKAREQLAYLCRLVKTLPEDTYDDIFQTSRPMDAPTEELLAQAEDESMQPMMRARGAYFGGLQLEQAGRGGEALAAYRRAFGFISGLSSAYFGLSSAPEPVRPRSMRSEPEMQRMLRHIAGKIRRLDPSTPDVLRGGLRFHVDEPELPPELGAKVGVTVTRITESAGAGPASDATPTEASSSGEVPIQLDRTGWVGLLDGRYLLSVTMGRRPGTPPGPLGAQLGPQYQFLEYDLTALPAEVEVRGETVDLPPIRPFFSKEIALKEPAEGAAIDLGKTEFRWEPVPEATRYEVEITGSVRTLGGTILKTFTARSIDAPAFKIDQLPAEDAQALRTQAPGTEGSWEVRAYDARGLPAGKILARRKFVIAGAAPVVPR